MELDREQLELAYCWFTADHVPGDPAMTAYKREARYRQAMLREANGFGRGSHANRKRRIAAGGDARVPNGSKLAPEAGAAGANFLSDRIRAAVEHRLQHPEPNQTLDRTRLHEDLLSSMPMCFNLFGELPTDSVRSRQTADLLLSGSKPGPVDVRFEWSPGRRSPQYTNDRTAFDVALLIGLIDDPRDFIGIETKYHEHACREPASRRAGRSNHEMQTQFLVDIANGSGVFRPGWESAVLETDLRQIWRDHLLVLAMLGSAEWGRGCYVLAYPSRNTSFESAARRYQSQLVEGDTTFRAVTVDELVRSGLLQDPATSAAFTHRYLWWMDEDNSLASAPVGE